MIFFVVLLCSYLLFIWFLICMVFGVVYLRRILRFFWVWVFSVIMRVVFEGFMKFLKIRVMIWSILRLMLVMIGRIGSCYLMMLLWFFMVKLLSVSEFLCSVLSCVFWWVICLSSCLIWSCCFWRILVKMLMILLCVRVWWFGVVMSLGMFLVRNLICGLLGMVW